jgi:hypothetical protein
MRNSRPLLWSLAGIAIAGAFGWLVLGPGASDPPAPSASPAAQAPHAPHDHAPAAQPAPALPLGSAHEDGHAHADLDHPDDLDGDLDRELAETIAALPLPPGDDGVAARPEPQALTPEDQRARRQASIDLLDRHIGRLEAEQQAAEASGDTRTAERNRIRVERMRQRRADLAAEPDDTSP